MEHQLQIGVVNRLLEDLAVDLDERSPGRLRLLEGLADRPLQEVSLHAASIRPQAELPLGARQGRSPGTARYPLHRDESGGVPPSGSIPVFNFH